MEILGRRDNYYTAMILYSELERQESFVGKKAVLAVFGAESYLQWLARKRLKI